MLFPLRIMQERIKTAKEVTLISKFCGLTKTSNCDDGRECQPLFPAVACRIPKTVREVHKAILFARWLTILSEYWTYTRNFVSRWIMGAQSFIGVKECRNLLVNTSQITAVICPLQRTIYGRIKGDNQVRMKRESSRSCSMSTLVDLLRWRYRTFEAYW